MVPLQRVMILEVSQYLENYLFPNFDPETAMFEHVMSMILMVNEKFRENVAAWVCFHDQKDAFNVNRGADEAQTIMRSWVTGGIVPCLCRPHFGD
ncbi:RNA helicase aquarius-like [Rosa chinensis]|uniref:RNA helicase aquarius-like n=1 Tax=Rosa chinensis TaxID=74649 RepID=UPI000D090079|nr:RNA helicase aquarius-like [Rosa chinensis]